MTRLGAACLFAKTTIHDQKKTPGEEGSSAENVAESYSNRNFANPSFRKPRFAGSRLTLQVPRNLSLSLSPGYPAKLRVRALTRITNVHRTGAEIPRKRFAALIESGAPVC
ncbi:hypothetical protein CDAR_59281 [Caerostris darwini]|uniref:Uncharacterized protein n=1 Tax=Caerostris darwini TaxID=1538125 RepID=A0AAV4X5I7_9ARAC|nr:hypothetical protein CDAR_59281 [Caerostris darwini]